MDFLNFVIALSPIVVVLVGILGFRQSAKRVAPVALLWTLLLAFTYFNVTGAAFKDNVAVYDALLWKGIKEGLKIVLMVFGAFVILNLLRDTGAIDEVKGAIARISDDRRVQVVIIGMMLPIFLEGAAGAGSPAAIAAPFLVALGFDPVTSIALALLGDATPCSWGGAGLTTINGGAALTDAGLSTVALNSAMVGRIHMFGVLVIPFIMVAMTFGRKGFKGIVPYLCFAGVSTGAVILICGFLGAMTLKTGMKQYGRICAKTVGHVLPVLVTMGSLLVVSYIMQSPSTGMMNLLASDIAAVVGRFYPAAAVLIGASGSFITGTGLGSNIMFADMHIQAAQALGMNPITVFAGQNAGASLGNLICPNNTVAACATVDQVGNENQVMKRTLPAFAVILVLYMVLTMLYTCVLFPHFGA